MTWFCSPARLIKSCLTLLRTFTSSASVNTDMPLEVREAEIQILHNDLDKLKALNQGIERCLGRINSSAQNIQDGLNAIEGDTRESLTVLGNIEGIVKAIKYMQTLAMLKGQAEDRQGWI